MGTCILSLVVVEICNNMVGEENALVVVEMSTYMEEGVNGQEEEVVVGVMNTCMEEVENELVVVVSDSSMVEEEESVLNRNP
ncbi:hypothetical protein Lal_00028618 [Lupinus albus]|nr:hypothetical protein Lal_00028618 [Lupinus albus]